MSKQRIAILLIPFTASLIVGTVLVFSYFDKQRTMEDTRNLFNAHIHSVARLVEEGTKEAVAATSMIYESARSDLALSAHLYAMNGENQTEPREAENAQEVNVLISDGSAVGDWGPIPPERQLEVLAGTPSLETDELLDAGVFQDLSLICIIIPRNSGKQLTCQRADSLNQWTSEVGIGPLLKGITSGDVLYVALQDQDGILAAAPSNVRLSHWKNDRFLHTSVGSPDGQSRLIPPVFEGVLPFRMMDDTVVALRIGISAKRLQSMQSDLTRRFWILLLLCITLLVLTYAISLLAWIWHRRNERVDRELKIREEQHRHWELVGQMAATVAHEVRNPLSTLQMISQRFKNEFDVSVEDEKEFKELTDLLISESGRVNRVVSEFLEIGKPLQLKREEVLISELVQDAIGPFQLRAKAEQKTIKTNFLCRSRFSADPQRIRQIVGNLMGNALDAMKAGGTVKVTTECTDTLWRLTIVDDGSGIPADSLEKVLKPFVSLKKTGTGLGLPLVAKLAEAHNGAFFLHSEQGRGTTTTIEIPNIHGAPNDN